MSDLLGTTLAVRYRVDTSVGRGGMAEVYKVWDSHRSAYLAMKLLHADLAQDPIFLRRFRREAQNLAKLQHPNIVRFYGLEQDDLLAFMLMDFVDGTTLRAEIVRLKGNPMSLDRVREIMEPVCAALNYAHRQGIVHCDVKPANVMIEKNGRVLLADFGIARMAEGATTMTMVGAGTPAYMAPEQARGDNPSPQSDIYAMGVMLFEMLTGGERPFTGEQANITGTSSEKVRWEHVNLKPPSPRKFNKSISLELEAIILKCLEKDPSKRFLSASDLLVSLLATAVKKHTPEKEPIPVAHTESIKLEPIKPEPVKPEPAKVESVVLEPIRNPQSLVLLGMSVRVRKGIAIAIVSVLGVFLIIGGLALLSRPITIAGKVASPSPSATEILAHSTLAPKSLTAQAVGTQAKKTVEAYYSGLKKTSQNNATAFATLSSRAWVPATPLPGLKITSIAGPLSGSLVHDEKNYIKLEYMSSSYRDFISQATFYVPYDSTTAHSWDFGFLFRYDVAAYRLIVESSGTWALDYSDDTTYYTVNSGTIPNLNYRQGDKNTVKIICYREKGWLYMNGKYISVLDLSALLDSGSISVATGLVGGNEWSGKQTDFSDFIVWEIASP